MLDIENLKKVPSSIEAEKSVLGGILLKPDIFGDIVEILSPNDFYKSGHKLIYEAMRDIYNSGTEIDPIVVVNKLKKNDKFDEIVGEELLYEIISDVPTAANIIEYAKIVKEKATLRRLGEVGTKIVELAYEGYEEVDTILDKAEGMIFKISENVDSKDLVSLKDVIAQEFIRLEKVYQNKGVATGISSGFSDFDQMTSGFHPSDLIILAARPAMGKTAFALNLALNAAMKGNKGVLLFSLEMSSSQLLQRLLSIEAGIALQKIRNGFLDPDDWGKLGLASMKLSNSEINIADLPNVNVLEIRAIARRLKAAGKLDMIVIDYLQLIKGSGGKNDNRQQEISEISRALKGIARELDIPIIALSQLSRATEQRADRRPMLSDLRESGAIEQDADMVLFLYRDDYYNEESEDKGLTEVIIGKQRNGPVGTVKLRFFHEYTKFANFSAKADN
jgi:replicative DNA helicase